MRKLLIGITILISVIIASSAMAAAPKVPKNLCFTYSGDNYMELAFKSTATILTSSGKVKMYTVMGNNNAGYDCPVHGSGYVAPGTTTFHATYNRMGGDISYNVTAYELFYNLEAETGTLYRRYDRNDGSIDTFTGAISVVECSTLAAPTGIAATEASGVVDR